MHLVQLGVDPKGVAEKERQEALGELRSYWIEQEAEFTAGQWAQKLAKEIRRARTLAKPVRAAGGTGVGHAGRVDWVEIGKRHGVMARAGETWDDLIKRIKAAQQRENTGT